MRGIWRCSPKRAFFILGILATPLFAKFDQTTGTKVDNSQFGGISDAELQELKFQQQLNQLQNAYIQSVVTRIKKFDDGDKSSKFGANGRYSGYGEAHIQNGDAMVSHDSGANGLEGAMEKGALGQTGLSGQARADAEKKVMDSYCTPITSGPNAGGCTNTNTGQLQKSGAKDISAALYDAGPAHGGPDDDHRVYAVKADVRKEVEKNGKHYAELTIKDATLAPGKQPNLDLLHKSFSKLEQDKYIMMATDAFAFRSARLDGTDTSKSLTKNTIGEYKQIAIDTYADPQFAGNNSSAEAAIRTKLAARVAEKRVLNDTNVCADGTIAPKGDCKDIGKKVTVQSADDAAAKILQAVGASQDGTKALAIKDAIKGSFDKTGKPLGGTPPTLADVMKNVTLRTLSGIADRAKLDDLYSQAKQNLDPKDQSKIGEYQSRLSSNDCLAFTGFCYSSGVAGSIDPKRNDVPKASGGKSDIDKDDPYQFQKVTGDPGNYFKDTRELLFNNFANAYNKPLAGWKNAVTNADFNQGTDKNIKDVGTYKEFSKMYDNAMAQAKNIQQNVDNDYIQSLKSAGATQQQLAAVQKNYGTNGRNNFDSSKLTHMQLFGQNKDRDAIMMDWRKTQGATQNQYLNPNYVNPDNAANKVPESETFPQNTITPGTPSKPMI